MQRTLRRHLLLILAVAGSLLPTVQAAATPYDGYTLYSPNGGSRTYLLDLDNSVVHTWIHTLSGGYSAYLLGDGSVLRPALSTNSNLNGGGAAGIVERRAADNTLAWEYSYSSNLVRTHHDIEPMPNGNVLLVAWERKTAAEAVAAGLDHSLEIWPDHIVEVEPTGATTGTIVWQWHFWDHLIQDHDPTKANYGVVADHPERLDINLGGSPFGGDWTHINAISYNPALDQIVISSHNLDELFVIDHSTTTAEAAGHTGGNAGRGGDILYRWGNPANYGAPGTRIFNVVHCSTWIPAGYPGAGNLLAFNNREGQGSSMVVEIVPPHDGTYTYSLAPGAAYGPAAPTWTYTAAGFYSGHLGGCQRLPNGNTLIAESTSGYLFEVSSAGALEWSFDTSGEIARTLRYGVGYPGLAALGIVGVEEAPPAGDLRLAQNYPNPFNPTTTISYTLPAPAPVTLCVFAESGREVALLVDGPQSRGEHTVTFDARGLPSGVYLYQLAVDGVVVTKKLMVLK